MLIWKLVIAGIRYIHCTKSSYIPSTASEPMDSSTIFKAPPQAAYFP